MPVILVGVINVTPDSFSDGARFADVEAAVAEGVAMAHAGAAWLDVGGESTRPGAAPVSEAEECDRVVPVIAGLHQALGSTARLCVDTYKSGTARAALAAGATVVNDISGGLLDPAILKVAAAARGTVVLGHLRGVPATMMDAVHFDDVVAEVSSELALRVAAARAAGCAEIWCDPGIGFGKSGSHSLALLRDLPALQAALGVPLMVGVSRKRFIGDITGKPVCERIFGTAAAVAAAVLGGASAVRVHDVAAMKDVVAVAEAMSAGGTSRA